MTLARSSRVNKGDDIDVIGIPREIGNWGLIRGNIVSYRGREIFFSAEVDEGNSGGPIVRSGEVIGLVTETGGYGRAVPVESLRLFVERSGVSLAAVVFRAVDRPTGKVFRDRLKDGSEGPEMVRIQGGCFQMGSPASEKGRGEDERQHQVCVEEFVIGKYEVTFEEYDRFGDVADREKPDDRGWGRGRHPVINVSWEDAVDYTDWLSRETGKRYRLPTEAEWEYAARAGTTTAYWWGNDVGSNRTNCNGCGSRWDNRKTAPVGSFDPNPFGLHDTAGNVWEWTCSNYSETYDAKNYNESEQKCALKGDSGPRSLRGGSWFNYSVSVRSASRFRFLRDSRYSYVLVGFRLARD